MTRKEAPMKAPPPRGNRGEGASNTPAATGHNKIREHDANTAPARPRGMVNFHKGTCWVCGTRVDPGAGIYSCSRTRYHRDTGEVAHRPDPDATGTTLERIASGCPVPPIVVILKPGQHVPRQKVSA